MYKKMVLAVVLLAGCSNETQQLEKEKSQLKNEINAINDKINDEKSKTISIDNTIKQLNSKIAMENGISQNMSIETYTAQINSYTTALSQAFSDYSVIQNKVASLKNDPQILNKLKEIKTKVESASKQFNDAFTEQQPPESFDEIHQHIRSADKEFIEAIQLLVTGYKDSDKQQYEKANSQLNDGINKIDAIQFQ